MNDSPGRPGSTDIRRLLTSGGASLPCGRSVDDVLAQVAEGRGDHLDPHQQQCPHCRAALLEFTRVWAPVAALSRTPVPTPSALVGAVMDHIHRLAVNVWYTMQVTHIGVVRVAARIVGRIARDAARTVPGVRAALGRTTHGRLVDVVDRATRHHSHPNAAVGVLGRTAAVDLAITVTYGQNIDRVATEVQRRVAAALQESVGLLDIAVNVHVDDVEQGPPV